MSDSDSDRGRKRETQTERDRETDGQKDRNSEKGIIRERYCLGDSQTKTDVLKKEGRKPEKVDRTEKETKSLKQPQKNVNKLDSNTLAH